MRRRADLRDGSASSNGSEDNDTAADGCSGLTVRKTGRGWRLGPDAPMAPLCHRHAQSGAPPLLALVTSNCHAGFRGDAAGQGYCSLAAFLTRMSDWQLAAPIQTRTHEALTALCSCAKGPHTIPRQ